MLLADSDDVKNNSGKSTMSSTTTTTATTAAAGIASAIFPAGAPVFAALAAANIGIKGKTTLMDSTKRHQLNSYISDALITALKKNDTYYKAIFDKNFGNILLNKMIVLYNYERGKRSNANSFFKWFNDNYKSIFQEYNPTEAGFKSKIEVVNDLLFTTCSAAFNDWEFNDRYNALVGLLNNTYKEYFKNTTDVFVPSTTSATGTTTPTVSTPSGTAVGTTTADFSGTTISAIASKYGVYIGIGIIILIFYFGKKKK